MFSPLAKGYLFRLRYYIAFFTLLYFLSIYLGYNLAASSPIEAQKIIEEFRQMFAPIAKVSSVELFAFIFFKNAVAAFLTVFLGIIFGILPLASLVGNGAILGIFAYFFFQKTSSVLIFFAGILPHGVIEIPAFLFSVASGFHLGMAALRRLILGEKKLRQKLRAAAKFYFFVILSLLFAAAIIETFVTPKILAWAVME